MLKDYSNNPSGNSRYNQYSQMNQYNNDNRNVPEFNDNEIN